MNKTVTRDVLFITLLLAPIIAVCSECTPEQKANMIKIGLTVDEIKKTCILEKQSKRVEKSNEQAYKGLAIKKPEPENWYAYWGLGSSSNSYSNEFDDVFSALESLPGAERTQIALDMFGFYWPLNNSTTIHGFVVNSVSDRVDIGNEYIALNQYIYAYSIMRFFGSEVGDGFFIRADVGIAEAIIETNYDSVVSESGVGALFGVGYGITLSKESRILLNFNIANRTIEDNEWSTAAFSVGILW